MKTVKPFIKWAGGKSQLLNEIRNKYPQKIKRYCEPFVGGGAVLLDVLANYSPAEVIINDINSALINTYQQVQTNVEALILQLEEMQAEFWVSDAEIRKKIYTQNRGRFNSLTNNYCLDKAALFIFLNKTCFNGLYRVNSKGLFNVPIGSYKKPPICDAENLRYISQLLHGVQIRCGDYRECTDFIDSDTFVYIDPPYRPLTVTASFTSYNENEFGDQQQIELGRFIDEITQKGTKVVASNSDPKNADVNDNFFDDLYAKYTIDRVYAKRMINSKANGRGNISEILITNGGFNMKRNFNDWLSNFRSSIANYSYYVDFDKVYRNVEEIKIELNILNSLIGSMDIENDFISLLKRYPETIKCIPILLAVRANEIYCQDENGGYLYKFDFGDCPPNSHTYFERCRYFMRETGLFDLLENHIINNLVDYVTGVETGLDSNGRKNRGGHLMEDLVESFIVKAGFIKGKSYFKEMYIHEITEKWGIDLSAISNQGKAEKRFDFVIKTENMIYGIETNFYTGGGSKLNETARSYKQIAQEADSIDGFTFVWFTDGNGWTSARHNLEETFDVMEHIYSIDDLENGVINNLNNNDE